jgi:hypothetical protein
MIGLPTPNLTALPRRIHMELKVIRTTNQLPLGRKIEESVFY